MDNYFMFVVFTYCFILYLVYIYLYVLYRERYLALWCLAGSLLIFKLSFDFIFVSLGLDYSSLPLYIKIIDQAVVMLSGLFMIWGAYQFFKMPLTKRFFYVFSLFIILSISMVLFNSTSNLISSPANIFVGITLFRSGILFIKNKVLNGLGNAVTGGVFISWGVVFCIYPFCRDIDWFIPWLYYLLSVCGALVVICLLITFFLKTRKELAISESKFRLLAENAQDVIYRIFFKPRLRVEYISPAAKTITGYTPEEYYSKLNQIYKRVHPEDVSQFDPMKGPSNKLPVNIAFRFFHKNNNMVWIEQRNTPIYNDSGKVVGYECIARDITENKNLEKRLEYLSYHDYLTGLGNRFYFEEHLQNCHNKHLKSIGIIVCDIDGLKLINDTLGHSFGDAVIKEAGYMIKKSFRENDITARIGGDEFAIILKNCKKETLMMSCSRLRQFLADHNMKRPDLPVYMSVGFAYGSDKNINIFELFKDADNMMYLEKQKKSSTTKIAISNTLTKTSM